MKRKVMVAVFSGYLVIAFLTSGFYNTLPLILVYAKTVNWLPLSLSLLLTLAIAWLVAINAGYVYCRYRERRHCIKETSTASLAAAGALATGICPLCISGVFPTLLGFFGVSFGFASLPFKGIEVQILVVVLLLTSIYMFRNQKG